MRSYEIIQAGVLLSEINIWKTEATSFNLFRLGIGKQTERTDGRGFVRSVVDSGVLEDFSIGIVSQDRSRKRSRGSQHGRRGLDLGAVPNLLIQTVGEIILEIIRAGDDVFTAAQRSRFRQGGGWHRSTFLILSRATIQRQI